MDNGEGYTDATALKLSIQELLQLAVQHNWIKQELLTALVARLQVYDHLHDTPFQYAIDNFIVQEAKEQYQLTWQQKKYTPYGKEIALSPPCWKTKCGGGNTG